MEYVYPKGHERPSKYHGTKGLGVERNQTGDILIFRTGDRTAEEVSEPLLQGGLTLGCSEPCRQLPLPKMFLSGEIVRKEPQQARPQPPDAWHH